MGLKVIWREELGCSECHNPGFNSTWQDLFAEPRLRLAENFPGTCDRLFPPHVIMECIMMQCVWLSFSLSAAGRVNVRPESLLIFLLPGDSAFSLLPDFWGTHIHSFIALTARIAKIVRSPPNAAAVEMHRFTVFNTKRGSKEICLQIAICDVFSHGMRSQSLACG